MSSFSSLSSASSASTSRTSVLVREDIVAVQIERETPFLIYTIEVPETGKRKTNYTDAELKQSTWKLTTVDESGIHHCSKRLAELRPKEKNVPDSKWKDYFNALKTAIACINQPKFSQKYIVDAQKYDNNTFEWALSFYKNEQGGKRVASKLAVFDFDKTDEMIAENAMVLFKACIIRLKKLQEDTETLTKENTKADSAIADILKQVQDYSMDKANTEEKYYGALAALMITKSARIEELLCEKAQLDRDLELAWHDHDPVEASAAASAKSTAKSTLQDTVPSNGSAPVVVRTGKKRGRSNGGESNDPRTPGPKKQLKI